MLFSFFLCIGNIIFLSSHPVSCSFSYAASCSVYRSLQLHCYLILYIPEQLYSCLTSFNGSYSLFHAEFSLFFIFKSYYYLGWYYLLITTLVHSVRRNYTLFLYCSHVCDTKLSKCAFLSHCFLSFSFPFNSLRPSRCKIYLFFLLISLPFLLEL